MVRAALGINSVAQRNAKATVPAALAGVFEGMTKNEWLTQCLPHVPVTLVWQRAGTGQAREMAGRTQESRVVRSSCVHSGMLAGMSNGKRGHPLLSSTRSLSSGDGRVHEVAESAAWAPWTRTTAAAPDGRPFMLVENVHLSSAAAQFLSGVLLSRRSRRGCGPGA